MYSRRVASMWVKCLNSTLRARVVTRTTMLGMFTRELGPRVYRMVREIRLTEMEILTRVR